MATHDTLAGPAAQGFQHDITMLGGEGRQLRDIRTDQTGSHQMAPAQGTQLFVPGPQGRGAIQHPHPLALS